MNRSQLRLIREAQGLSLRKAAGLARIDPGQLSKIERGEAGMTLKSFLRLCRVLGLADIAKQIGPLVKQERAEMKAAASEAQQ